MTDESGDLSLNDFLEAMAAPGDPVGSGVGAATACAMSAALVTMAARASVECWEDAGGIAAQARTLQVRAQSSTRSTAAAYETAARQLRPAKTGGNALGPALAATIAELLEICRIAADVAELAALATSHAQEDVRPDAAAAASLAYAAAQVGAHLITVNLAVTEDDPRRAEADESMTAAGAACRAALAAD